MMSTTAGQQKPGLRQLERDEEGFLRNADDWYPELADAFAARGRRAADTRAPQDRALCARLFRRQFRRTRGAHRAQTHARHMGAPTKLPANARTRFFRPATGSRRARSPACASSCWTFRRPRTARGLRFRPGRIRSSSCKSGVDALGDLLPAASSARPPDNAYGCSVPEPWRPPRGWKTVSRLCK